MKVSVLIVSFNTRDLTLACLRSVLQQTRRVPNEVIVVDNGSTDGSAEAIGRSFPTVMLIAAGRNLGFAAANNLAAQHATGDHLLLLNPDTVVLGGAIERLCKLADGHPDAGIYGGRTLFADGRLNPASCWGQPTVWSTVCRATGLAVLFKGSRFFDPEPMAWWARDDEREVGIVSGCFLLIRQDVWKALGGFDTSFFMYGEDFDLCMRARKNGWRPRITPAAAIVHYGGASDRAVADQTVRQFKAKAHLFARHWDPLRAWILVRMLDLWALRRVILATVRPGRTEVERERRQAWNAVWRRRHEWHLAPQRPSAATEDRLIGPTI